MPAFDPELASVLRFPQAAHGEDTHPPTIDEVRAQLDQYVVAPFKAYQEPLLPPASAYSIQDRVVPVEGGEITVRCIVPVVDNEHETFPVLVNMHGGGWSAGSVELDDYFLRTLSVDLKLSTVNVEYRLAPEHPFPTAVNDCIAALKWVVLNTPLLKADLNKGFLVCGHSAGANLSAVLAHETRDDPFFHGPGRQLTGHIAREPLVIHPDAYPDELKPSMRAIEENGDLPPVPRAAIYQSIGFYNPPPTDPRFSPLLYASHRGVPHAFVQGNGCDPMRDDARAYVRALREAGVECRYIEYPGVTHGFHYEYPAIGIAVRARKDLVQGILWLLGRE